MQTEIRSLRKEQEFPSPSRFKLFTRQNERTSLDRILNERLVTFDLRQYDIAPVRSLHNGRERSSGEFVPVRFAQSGLETKMFGSTEEICIGEWLARLGKLMTQLRPSAGKS